MEILYARPAASGVSTLVEVSGNDTTYIAPAGLLPSGGSTLDYALWGAVGVGLGRYVMEEKQPKRLAMYALGAIAVRLFL